MKKSNYTEEQIAFALKQAELGTPVSKFTSCPRLSKQVQQAAKRKNFGRSTKAECFSGAVIEQVDDTVDIRLGDGMEVEFLGEVLAKQAVGIFI